MRAASASAVPDAAGGGGALGLDMPGVPFGFELCDGALPQCELHDDSELGGIDASHLDRCDGALLGVGVGGSGHLECERSSTFSGVASRAPALSEHERKRNIRILRNKRKLAELNLASDKAVMEKKKIAKRFRPE